VDLARSENAKQAATTVQASGFQNVSLLALSTVINNQLSSKSPHVSYRQNGVAKLLHNRNRLLLRDIGHQNRRQTSTWHTTASVACLAIVGKMS